MLTQCATLRSTLFACVVAIPMCADCAEPSTAQHSATVQADAAASENDGSARMSCNQQDGLRFCVAQAAVIPEGGSYVATVSVLLESTTNGASYYALIPMGRTVELDAEGVSGWQFYGQTGLKHCNSSSDASCATSEPLFTKLTPGSKVTYRLRKIADEQTGAALLGVKTGSVTFRWLIGREGGVIRGQTFTVSDFPLRVVLARAR